jgi:hypothetical protein
VVPLERGAYRWAGCAALAVWLIVPGALQAQLATGRLEGTVKDADGKRLAGADIRISGAVGLRWVIRTDPEGEFSLVLPYGWYRVSDEFGGGVTTTVTVRPLQVTRVRLVKDRGGELRAAGEDTRLAAGTWGDTTQGKTYPEGFTLGGVLLSREPASVTQPLDFTGLGDNRLGIESQWAFSWTDTQYRLQGMDATDAYQPGLPAIAPDIEAMDAIVVRSGFALTTSASAGTEAGLFLAQAASRWHGSVETADTGAALSGTNLPAPAASGLVRQDEAYRWFTRDGVALSGPLTRFADFSGSARGQWSSQAEPLEPAGTRQRSRMWFANAGSRISAGRRDQFDVFYSGSAVHLSDGGVPAALEALMGYRMAPSFVLPGGFAGEPEDDRFDFVQLGWTHAAPGSAAGVLQLRYGYSAASLDTVTPARGQSRIELAGGAVTGAAPLGNLARRPRQAFDGAWQPRAMRAGWSRHELAVSGEWEAAVARNRFTVPSGMNLVTAGGAPAFVMEFNTPADSRERIRTHSSGVADHMILAPSFTADLGMLADFSRGSAAARPDVIAWNTVSPRAGVAFMPPHLHGLILRGSYFRVYVPLAGRYLDFGNPDSLGGGMYQWLGTDAAAPFQPQDVGNLLVRFGGPYSSIASGLRRPYAGEFDLGAGLPLARRTLASVHLFRRDERNRLAATDTGVPFTAFTPVVISDPGPDGTPGSFDDQRLTVYSQKPSTLGQDLYLLTNPAGLRMLNTGLMAEVGAALGGLDVHASFVAEKSYGPTNPGDSVYENDPGVIGSLFEDPNTLIHAGGRSFVDRAYVGKVQAGYRLPAAWGGLELETVADYTDGLVFARQLLVTGLPQGPMLVATTVRGSPEGGNRAQYAINWNLRLSRSFELARGEFRVMADVMNVTNAAQSFQENDISGPSFNLRLPVAIEPPRFVRLGVRYEF